MKTSLITLCIPVLIFFASTEKKPESTIWGNLDNQFAIVQLFTSQGCSSCPRADLLLDELKEKYKDENVVVLSYHVDYWDRLGWKDPFSSKEYTQLQYNYADKFKDKSVYTPEAVINGAIHFVGSNESKMNENLQLSLKKQAENSIKITKIEKVGKQFSFEYLVKGTLTNKDLQIALVIDNRKTEVKKGENGGRILNSSNVVVNQVTFNLNKESGKAAIQIPEVVNESDMLNIVGFVQQKNLIITGATQVKIL